jgi:hypothetical protein
MSNLAHNQVLTTEGRVVSRPSWVNPVDLQKEMSSFQQAEFVPPPPREEFVFEHLDVTVVYRTEADKDIIFQVFPKTRFFPRDPSLARTLLAEVIEAHFGDTSNFEAGYTPELKSWAIKAKSLQKLLSFDPEYHVRGFVQLLHDTLLELE